MSKPIQKEASDSTESSLLLSKETEISLMSETLGSADSLLATPIHNADVIVSIVSVTNINHDPLYLYDTINASRFAAVWDGLLVGGGILSLCLGVFAGAYRKLRKQEGSSHFSYYRHLTIQKKAEIRDLLDTSENKDVHRIAATAVYFYSPDISKWIGWLRRSFCWGKKKKEFKELQSFLKAKKEKDKKTEKIILEEVFQEIIDNVVFILNKKNSQGLAFEHKPNSYLIELTKESKKEIVADTQNILNKIVMAPATSLANIFFDAVGSASFIYWLIGFIFYFIPVGIVAGLSFPPLLIAFAFLAWQIGYALGKNTNGTSKIADTNSQKEKLLTERIIAVCKRQTLVEYTCGPLVSFKGSQLEKDLEKILRKRRFAKIHAALDGFVGGCFYVFFAAWLFGDLFKLIAGLAIGTSITGPAAPACFATILMAIAATTLVVGIGYGIYRAIQAIRDHESRYNNLAAQVQNLRAANSSIKGANLPLQNYDRLLRRYCLEKTSWTTIKKTLNRGFEIIKRLGTGSLVFRLVIAGSLLALTPLVLSSTFFIAGVVIFAVLAAAWSYAAYQMNSEVKQAENVLQHISQHAYLTSLNQKKCEKPSSMEHERKAVASQKIEPEHKTNTVHESKTAVSQKVEPEHKTKWGMEHAPDGRPILISLFYTQAAQNNATTSNAITQAQKTFSR